MIPDAGIVVLDGVEMVTAFKGALMMVVGLYVGNQILAWVKGAIMGNVEKNDSSPGVSSGRFSDREKS